MTDDLRKAFEEMRRDLGAVKERLGAVEALQRQTAELQAKAADATAEVTRRFDTFLVRFQEASEMLVTHDTEQPPRQATRGWESWRPSPPAPKAAYAPATASRNLRASR